MDQGMNCPVCGAHVASQEEMDKHSQMHSKTEENKEEHAITCSKCGVKVNTQEELQKHVGETHKM